MSINGGVTMSTVFKLNGTTIKRPNHFRIERYNLTKAGRVASGLMIMDLIAKKRKFIFRYTTISSTDLNIILNVIDGDAMFFDVSYVENGVTKNASCYSGHIPTNLFRTGNVWYWTDVNFDLIER